MTRWHHIKKVKVFIHLTNLKTIIMKKIFSIAVITCLLFVACAKNKAEKEEDLLKDFKLDLSEMNIDFTKPQLVKYETEFQRDSILQGLSREFSESFQDSLSQIDSIYYKVLVSVGKEANTIKIQVQNDSDISFTDWNDLGICADDRSLNEKMHTFLVKNATADFGVEYVKAANNFNLYAKK